MIAAKQPFVLEIKLQKKNIWRLTLTPKLKKLDWTTYPTHPQGELILPLSPPPHCIFRGNAEEVVVPLP